jgi:hypothetical protein
MHDDDETYIFGHRIPGLNRRRIRFITALLAALSFILLVVAVLDIQSERTARKQQVNNEIRELACAVVAPYPNTVQYVIDFRNKYDCPDYSPNVAKQLIPDKATPSKSGATPSNLSSSKPSGKPLPGAAGQTSPSSAPSTPAQDASQAPSKSATLHTTAGVTVAPHPSTPSSVHSTAPTKPATVAPTTPKASASGLLPSLINGLGGTICSLGLLCPPK